MILFYSEECDGQQAKLLGSEAIHCKQALRKAVGDQVYVTDGLGQCFIGEISNISKKEVLIALNKTVEVGKKRGYKIHIGIAPTKNISRLEWFLEKATEFGIDEITPLMCARSERKVIKEERLRKILVSAMKQSLKCELPVLNPLTKYSDFVAKAAEQEQYIAHLEEEPSLLIETYGGRDVLLLIGPEGDFTPKEIKAAEDHGFQSVSLGDYRLRTETAGIAAVQQIHFLHQLKKH